VGRRENAHGDDIGIGRMRRLYVNRIGDRRDARSTVDDPHFDSRGCHPKDGIDFVVRGFRRTLLGDHLDDEP
jgi:hypothetical protein